MSGKCPSGADIAAYLEGALDADSCRATEAHLVVCPPCANHVEGMRVVEDLIRRQSCPSQEVRFAALVEGRSSPQAKCALDHMEACPLCRRELQPLPQDIGLDVLPEEVPASLEDAFFRRFSGPVSVALGEVPLAEAAPPLVAHRQLAEVQVDLRFAGQYSGLSVAVALRDRLSSRPLVGIVVNARSKDGKERAEAVTDDQGIARLSLRSLKPSKYSLELSLETPVALGLELHR